MYFSEKVIKRWKFKLWMHRFTYISANCISLLTFFFRITIVHSSSTRKRFNIRNLKWKQKIAYFMLVNLQGCLYLQKRKFDLIYWNNHNIKQFCFLIWIWYMVSIFFWGKSKSTYTWDFYYWLKESMDLLLNKNSLYNVTLLSGDRLNNY